MSQTEVVIASAARTPIGSFQGALSSLVAPELGAAAIREAVKRAAIQPEQVERVFMGCVLSAGIGQAPARQAVIKAGLPVTTGSVTLNKVCGSGLQAVMFARREIQAGEAEVMVAGGMESMSNAPYLLPGARNGYRMGNGSLVDSMVHDGLWDPYDNVHMGNCGDACAAKYGFTREEQDAFAKRSFERAIQAQKAGKFKAEIVPVSVPSRKGDPVVVENDEGPGQGAARQDVEAEACVLEGRHRHGGQRLEHQRRRRRAGGDVRRRREAARHARAGPHRGRRLGGGGAQVVHDRSGGGAAAPLRQDEDEGRRLGPLRDQRGLRRA